MKNNKDLIQKLKTDGVLRSKEIEKALKKVDRTFFVPRGQKMYAYFDSALPVAEGQTISQPTTVVIMLELLDVKPGQRILDIGAGSGWVSCLLSELVKSKGKVFAYEINQVVGGFGRENIENFGAQHQTTLGRTKNIEYKIVDAAKEWHKKGPFDRIYAAAAFKEIPKELLKQLKIGGILVAPMQDGNVVKITRIAEDDYDREECFGFAFVPFVEE